MHQSVNYDFKKERFSFVDDPLDQRSGKNSFLICNKMQKFPVSAFEAYKAVFISNDNLIASPDSPGPRLLG
jgi:hypothetical protein